MHRWNRCLGMDRKITDPGFPLKSAPSLRLLFNVFGEIVAVALMMLILTNLDTKDIGKSQAHRTSLLHSPRYFGTSAKQVTQARQSQPPPVKTAGFRVNRSDASRLIVVPRLGTLSIIRLIAEAACLGNISQRFAICQLEGRLWQQSLSRRQWRVLFCCHSFHGFHLWVDSSVEGLRLESQSPHVLTP